MNTYNNKKSQKEINDDAINYALKKEYQNKNDLILILGSSNNDNRFNKMEGFTINWSLGDGNEGEKDSLPPSQDPKMIQLLFNLEGIIPISLNLFKFNKIYFDYNVSELINKNKNFFHKFYSLLGKNGKFYIPYTTRLTRYSNSLKFKIPTFLENNLSFSNDTYSILTENLNLQKLNFGDIFIFIFKIENNVRIFKSKMNHEELKTFNENILKSYFDDSINIETINTNDLEYPIEPRIEGRRESFSTYFIISKS